MPRIHRGTLFGVAVTVVLLLFGLTPGRAPAAYGADEPPKPAQKDSSTRAKPKDVVLTTSIEPAQAKPGDTVTFKVTAKLNPGWHIYTQAKTQEGDGPRKTVFDLFDTAGLEATGTWKADKKPESKAEPAFDNQVFEYFEDEVSWSISLKIPAGTAAGKKQVRVQASYQVCNAQSCSFPGRWTLPDATLTVVAADGAGGEPVRQEANKPQLALAPAEKDSSVRIRPKGVTLTPSVAPAEAHPGGSVVYKVTARLEPGLHIYAVNSGSNDQQGPIPTTFDFFDPGGLKVSKAWKPDHAPEVRAEPAFNDQLIEFFENEVTWSTTLEIPADATPGKRTLRRQAGYQICNDRSCFPPGRWTLEDITLTILPAAAKPSATTTPIPIQAAAPAPPNPAAAATAAGKPVEPAPAPVARSSATPAPASNIAEKPAAGSNETSPTARDSAAPVSEIARRAQQGLIPFLIASALGGLFALVMPCVWPMVPITVNFFVKQGQGGPGEERARPRDSRWPTAWQSSAYSRWWGSSSRSFSRPASCKTWPITRG